MSAARNTPTRELLPEQVIARRITAMVGYTPVGIVDLMRVLAHPDVIDLTRAYFTDKALGESDA